MVVFIVTIVGGDFMITNCRDNESLEIEVTLIICSENPKMLVEQIANIKTLSKYTLLHKDPIMIQ